MNLFQAQPPQNAFLTLLAVATLGSGAIANAASYPNTVLADKPVAYYRFEDPTNSFTVADSSSSGANPGNVNWDDFMAWPRLEQPGLGSNSIAFHPYLSGGFTQKSSVSVPYSPDLNQPGPFTAEAWVRATSTGAAGEWRSPVCNFGGWGNSSGWFFYQSPGDPGPSVWIWVQKGGGIWIQTAQAVRKNQWDYLAAVFDGAKVTFYVNAVEIGSSTDAATALPNSGQPFCMGYDPAGDWKFDGNVDEVAIYTNALTADQLRLHYEVGLTNFAVPPVPPYITGDPAPATAYAGRDVSFLVGADGTAPLAYQWYKGNTPLAGETTDTLIFTCAYADNNAQYKVVITNLYGSVTSAPVGLTVLTDLTLISSPASITRNVGSKAAFIAVPGGAVPVHYQWYKGTTAIPGATDQTLWLSNLQLSDSGATYYAHITNAWFSTNSETATLTVTPRTAVVPITGYAKVVMADDPVAFWRLDEPEGSATAVDAAGSFDGEYNANGAGNFSPGLFTFGALAGIPYETNKAVIVTNGARISIPYALELNPHGPFTAEAWVQPSSVAWDGSDYRTVFSSEGSGPTGWLLYQQPDSTFAWVVFNDNWVSSFIGDPVTVIASNTWYHVVLVYDGSLFHIYVNGQRTVSAPYDIFIPNRNGATQLGWRSDNDWRPFAGTIDDVAFYNKALSLGQIQAHYAATVRLSIAKSGNDIVLSWPFGTLQQADLVTGTFNDMPTATSPFTNAPAGSAKFYRVKVQ